MANDYCTTSEIQGLLPDVSWSTAYNTLLSSCATWASRAIDRYVKREPGAFAVTTAETRYYAGDGSLILWTDEMAAAPTTVAVAETYEIDDAANTGGTYTTWATSDYLLWPANATSVGQPFLQLTVDNVNGSKSYWHAGAKTVKVTAKFGYSTTVPDDVKMATLAQALWLFERMKGGLQVANQSAAFGGLMYKDALAPEAQAMIDHYRRLTI